MKHKITNLLLLVLLVTTVTSCKKYLDVNSDPDTTQQPSFNSVFPTQLAIMPYGIQRDALFAAKYIQNWNAGPSGNADTYDRHGYVFGGGTMANTWYMTYYGLGKNLNYIIDNAKISGQFDCAGAALALKAWSFQHTTDWNSDIPFYDAFNDSLLTFKYNSQDTIYHVVDSICRLAISYLNQAAGATGQAKGLTNGDFVYNGDVAKWKKFAYGIMARNWHHLTNKAGYSPDSVIRYCDNAMASVNDDFCVGFDATNNDNSNFFGTYRDNLSTIRQSNFIVRLLDGTAMAGSNAAANRDPRMSHMLTASNDTTNGNGGYRGVDPGAGDPNYALGAPSSYFVNGLPPTSGTALTNYNNARKKVSVVFGDSIYANPSAAAFSNTGKYLFKNNAVMPVMTYAEMQFIKAEAAYIKGDKELAYIAYIAGINAHFDFINRSYSSYRNGNTIYNGSPISGAARAAYLNGANVKKGAGTLTKSDIMLQKYIALWAWGFYETWVDLRRYNYTEIDPATAQQVYKTFNMPSAFFSDNLNQPVQRVRPHFTSEYTYNRAELNRLGILTPTYHTKKMWFSQP